MNQKFCCPHCGHVCDIIIPVIDSGTLVNHAMAMTEITMVLNALDSIPESRIPAAVINYIDDAKTKLQQAADTLMEGEL